MTEEVQTPNSTEEAQPSVATPEQLTLIRNSMFNTVAEAYKQFISVLRSVPIQPEAFHQAILFTDSGMLWAKEAIMVAPFMQLPTMAPVPPAPAAASVPAVDNGATTDEHPDLKEAVAVAEVA